VGKDGFLENVEIIIDITKIYEKTSSTKTDSMTADEIQVIAEAAYIYGYPLVTMDITMKQMTNVPNPGEFSAPLNQFAHVPEYPDPDFKAVVSPNADTLYSSTFLDLSKEPIVLHVPDVEGRYYLMPMLDAWTNVFASPGKRTTGTGANDFVITGPFWDGIVPEGTTQIKSPTNLVWIIGRTQTNGPADYDAVHKIQEQYALTPLSSFGKPYQPPQDVPIDPTVDMKTPPGVQTNNLGGPEFFNRMALLMKENPPAAEDAEVLKKFEKIGLYPGKPFDTTKLSPQTIEILEQTPKTAQQKILSNFKDLGAVVNGWTVALNIGAYDVRYTDRATIALVGLGANLPQDAVYPATYLDNEGNGLNGANKYVMHFEQPPPVGAFWSITMYGKDKFFVENPIERYAIGDRDDISYNEDGSLDIYIQYDTPEGNESNWLPSPPDDFQLIMRLYWPEDDVLSGKWQPPPVEKVE
jgi:DNA sulfur modification protein DndE